MDRKKLIGTIIGVILFVALIAGATFAWLTFNANVTNGNYNVSTGNFLVDYQGDTELTDIKTLSNVTAANVATSGATKVTVKAAKKTADSANGTLTVKLTTTSTGDTALDLSSGVLKYSVQVGTNTASAPQAVPATSSTTALDLTTIDLTSTTQTNVTVYFWLDSSILDNDDIGKTYQGYVHASAEQAH